MCCYGFGYEKKLRGIQPNRCLFHRIATHSLLWRLRHRQILPTLTGRSMFKHLTQVAETSGQLTHVRGMGAVVAADFYQIALQNGAL